MTYRQLSGGCILFLTVLMAAGSPSKKDRQMSDSLTSDMETHCIGRHLIDLPKSFRPMEGNTVTLYYGTDKNYKTAEVTVVQNNMSQEVFEHLVQSDANRIAKDLRDDYKTSMLISNTKLHENEYLLRGYRNDATEALKSYFYLLKGASAILITQETYKGGSIQDNENHLKKIASQIRSFTDPEQAGRGFCMGHIVIDGDHDFEQAYELNFQSDRWKDIWFFIGTNSLGSGDDGLLKRLKDNESTFKAMTFGAASPQFHSGKITMGNMPGEESLAKLKDYGKLGFDFTAESLTAKSLPGFEKPSLRVKMKTGSARARNKQNAVDSSWPKDEALDVWNAVIKSIRLRSGAL